MYERQREERGSEEYHVGVDEHLYGDADGLLDDGWKQIVNREGVSKGQRGRESEQTRGKRSRKAKSREA